MAIWDEPFFLPKKKYAALIHIELNTTSIGYIVCEVFPVLPLPYTYTISELLPIERFTSSEIPMVSGADYDD